MLIVMAGALSSQFISSPCTKSYHKKTPTHNPRVFRLTPIWVYARLPLYVKVRRFSDVERAHQAMAGKAWLGFASAESKVVEVKSKKKEKA